MKKITLKSLLIAAIFFSIIGTIASIILISKKVNELRAEGAREIFMDLSLGSKDWLKEKGYTEFDPNKADSILDQRGGVKLHFAYIFGIFLSCLFIPIILWLLYFIIKYQNKNEVKNSKIRLIKSIKSFPNLGDEFTKKENSLIELKELGVLSNIEFEEKLQKILDEYIRTWNEEQNKINRKQKKEQEDQKTFILKKALNEGLISKEEYDSKIEEITRNNKL
jgi:hypothetical protein